MATYKGAPRVRVVEKDLSQVATTQAFPNTTVGIIGCGLKGPIGYPVRLQSLSQLQNTFGLPTKQEHKSLIAAATILNAGGNIQFVNLPRNQYYRHLILTANATNNVDTDGFDKSITVSYIDTGVKAEQITGDLSFFVQQKLEAAKAGIPYGVSDDEVTKIADNSVMFISRVSGSNTDAEWVVKRVEPALRTNATKIVDTDEQIFNITPEMVYEKVNTWAEQYLVASQLVNVNYLIRVTFALASQPDVTFTKVFSVSKDPEKNIIANVSYLVDDIFEGSEIYVAVSDTFNIVFGFDVSGTLGDNAYKAKCTLPFRYEEDYVIDSDDGTYVTTASAEVSAVTRKKTAEKAISLAATASVGDVTSANVDGIAESAITANADMYDYFFGDVEQLKVDIVVPVLATTTGARLIDYTTALDGICNPSLAKVPANVTLGVLTGTIGSTGSGEDIEIALKGRSDDDGNKIPSATVTVPTHSGFAVYAGKITVRNFLNRIPLVPLDLGVVAAAIMCYNDFSTGTYAPWLPPMGVDGGTVDAIIPGVVVTSDAVQQKVADALYDARVNFLRNIPGYGNVIMGQKTTQRAFTALNRINVRRLVNYIKYITYRIAFPYIGRLNTVKQRSNLFDEINTFANRIKLNNGVYDYKLILDDTNNTPEVIDNNGLVMELKIQPTKAIEYIDPITITVTRTGVKL